MKPLTLIPPAQAEALHDAQQEAPAGDRLAPLPWLDDDGGDESDPPAGAAPPGAAQAGRNAQLWPSSSNNSRWKSWATSQSR